MDLALTVEKALAGQIRGEEHRSLLTCRRPDEDGRKVNEIFHFSVLVHAA